MKKSHNSHAFLPIPSILRLPKTFLSKRRPLIFSMRNWSSNSTISANDRAEEDQFVAEPVTDLTGRGAFPLPAQELPGDDTLFVGTRRRSATSFRRKGSIRPSESMLGKSLAKASCSSCGLAWTRRARVDAERGHRDGSKRCRNVAQWFVMIALR